MVEILIFRHLVTFGQRAGIAAYRVQQFLYGLLDKDASVIHDDAVVYQALHVLNDVRGQENCFVFRTGVVAQIVHKEAAVAGVQAEREIVQHQQFRILRQDKSQCHLRTLSARHTRDALSGSYFQFVHQVVVGFLTPLSRIESRIKLLNLPDSHELILHVSFDEQADITARRRVHGLNVLSEDGTLAGAGFQVTAQYIDRCGFSCTVFPQQSQNTPFGYAETEVLVNQPFAIIVRQVVAFNDILH